uniref:Bestrophin homolog n=1 Tax=Macrostomum lignano TaxID=282301 RepID=A0A1I8JNB4_9PLAT
MPMPRTPQSMMRTRFFGCAFDGFVGTSPIVLTTSKRETTTLAEHYNCEPLVSGVAVLPWQPSRRCEWRQDEGLIVECLAEDAGSAGAVLAHHVAHLNDEKSGTTRCTGCSTSPLADFQPRAQGREVHRRSAGASSPNTATVNRGKVVAGPSRSLISILEPDLLGDRVLRLGNLVGIFRGDRGGNGRSKSHQNQGEEGVAELCHGYCNASAPGSHVCSVGCLFVPAVGWVLSSVVPTNDDGFCWGDAWVDAKQRDGQPSCSACRTVSRLRFSDKRQAMELLDVSSFVSTLTVWFYQRCGNVAAGLPAPHFVLSTHEMTGCSLCSPPVPLGAGSVWQLLWIDYLIFTLMYVGLAVLYFNLLYTHAELKATFEVTVAWLKAIRTSVPLSFMLGFFVSAVFGRLVERLHFDSVASLLLFLLPSSGRQSEDESRSDLARKLRITVLRYLNLAWILMMAGVSLHIKERFGYWQPKWRKFQLTWQRRLQLINSDSKVQKYFGQLVTDKEMQAFAKSAELSNDNDHSYDPEYWLPLMWATRLIRRAKNLGQGHIGYSPSGQGHIGYSHAASLTRRQYLFLVNIINNFRGNLGHGVGCTPSSTSALVYTQVAVTAVYLFLASTLISTQLVDSDILLLENFPSRNGTVTRTLGLNLLSYLPVIGSLEFIFYLGEQKVQVSASVKIGRSRGQHLPRWIDGQRARPRKRRSVLHYS